MNATAQNSNVTSAFMAMEDKKYEEAVGYIEPAILNEGTMVKEKTWRYRAQIYSRIVFGDDAALKGKFPDALDKAVASYQKAMELDTKGAEKEDNVRALEALQGTALNEGNAAFEAKNYDKAVASYAMSEKIAKSFGKIDSNAVFNSALAYESKGDLPKALERYQECIKIGYDKPEIYRYAASLQNRNKDLEGGLATIGDGLKRHAGNKELMLDYISYLQEANRVAEAEPMVVAALEKDPSNAVLHSLLASIYEGKGKIDEAEAEYKKSIELDPQFFDGQYNIGVLYNNRAAAEYEKCNALKDDAAYTKCKKVADEVFVKAIPYFEQAHSLKPEDKQTISQLKTLYAKAGNTAKFEEMKKLLGE
ncbi:MAG: tetratricopeptide repeat protein [Flavobacteriales bacterium]|nr:tetratricopeptide repeat protein [Flavobacteriales bacterium]